MKPAADEPAASQTWVQGVKYRVEYWSYEEVGERVKRTRKTVVMKYLGFQTHTGYLQFDLRPLAGTQALDPREVIDHKAVADDVELHLPRPVG